MRSSPTSSILRPTENGERYELRSPTAMPAAGGFMWNQRMMIQVTSRGYATAQFMQPEPAKYSYAPNIEAKTFMQPEKNYFAHHPGRFVYVKDEQTGEIFSAPYEPVRAQPDRFSFSVGKSDIRWSTERLGLRVDMTLVLPTHDIAELWTIRLTNVSGRPRRVSVYPHFTIGYMSWMNQSARWNPDLGGIVGSSITPYQKSEDYFKNKLFKDKTFFLCEKTPVAWEAMHAAFEGEGGLHDPSALKKPQLSNSDAIYETPTAVVQYREELPGSTFSSNLSNGATADSHREYRFLFGPAKDEAEILSLRDTYLSKKAFDATAREYAAYIERGRGCLLKLESPDRGLDNFVNHWLARQVYYHGDVNRLATDPQTRNYLQDNMGMSFIRPSVARSAFITALGQQEATGAMPDGIILVEGGELKYINQVPHTDHCVWLPVTLEVYLSETADYALLDEKVTSRADGSTLTVFERFSRAMDWLLSDSARDALGLSYIAQGDWCDPMNMVGYKGKGVSAWLTIATAWALKLWADVCEQRGEAQLAARYRAGAAEANEVSNRYFWDGQWYSRGITDDGVTFGVKDDKEGRIWINPQSFAILGGAVNNPERLSTILDQIESQLTTPYGVQMFAPAYTSMREDVGRVTQKAPGSAENASVYNHAAAFYVHALYSLGGSEAGRAYKILRKMIPGPDEADFLQRGQLPVYIPNYYRGAWHQFPRTAGRSSQLFNTGTISWVYRVILEGLCGLKGDARGLAINPQLPPDWNGMTVTRLFRGATFRVEIRRSPKVGKVQVRYEEGTEFLPVAHIRNEDIEEGEAYRLCVFVPGEIVE